MKVIQDYDRHLFEIHQQGESGNWHRLVSSGYIDDDNEKEMFKQVLEKAGQSITWSKGLEGFLPSELLRVGKLRLVRVRRRNEVFDLDVKKAMTQFQKQHKKV